MPEKTDAIVYDMANQGSFQCLAVAFTKESKKNLEESGYICFFTPERDGTNCYFLVREKSGQPIPDQEPSKKERLENALLEYIEKNTKDTTPEIAATIPSVAMALVELWKG